MRIVKPTMSIYAEHTAALRVGGDFEIVLGAPDVNMSRAKIISEALVASDMVPNKVSLAFRSADGSEVVESITIQATRIHRDKWEIRKTVMDELPEEISMEHTLYNPANVYAVVAYLLEELDDGFPD